MAGEEAQDGSKIEPAEMQALKVAVDHGIDYKRKAKDKYAFWETQPVTQFKEAINAEVEDGPIDEAKTPADVRQEPLNLPDSFEWCTCDLSDEAVAKEVYELLSANYVEDDDNMFRFNYSPSFLKWALQPPGWQLEWLVGVRVKASKKLVGFISAVPANMRSDEKTVRMVEINFLCVHKKLRSKRLAPVLIKEITRRVNQADIWQAAYTAGVLIPKPIATCRYWHRSLNPKKLIDVGFSRLAPRMTLARTIKLYKLPDAPLTPGLREMQPKDVPAVRQLLNSHLTKYRLSQVFDDADVAHLLKPQHMVVDVHVVESASGEITDMLSFYTLPSTILGHPEHNELRAAYMYYTVPGSTTLTALLHDAMILAAAKGYDVFNALDLQDNSTCLKELKFGIGDGSLHYYLFNWRVKKTLTPTEVGLILV
uniref:Glycylpeptide N-tetradecanoyltransferase n=1 Tax=Chlamydomonas euryale TaxID=1486919 RepID=A0A7R9V3N1_9CHLO|mmetsp:Transcript_16249/g.48389  ORF Transcript_16249/g.48389 Transcript_16249/m.48389 type:complete len:424 (+) Transcript_16249:109-1380(+)